MMPVFFSRLGRRIPAVLVAVAGSAALAGNAEAGDPPSVTRWDFGTEEPVPMTIQGDAVRDQPGPRPPEFPDFTPENTAIQLKGKGARIEIADPGGKSAFDFTNGDAITMEAWVKLDGIRPGQPMYVVSKGRTHSPHFSKENQNWSLRLVGGEGDVARLSFLFTAVKGYGEDKWHRWTSEAAFEVATGWHHVAVAYEFGKPESIRGWIDGQSTSGTWDLGGPTTDAPVVDDDQVWIGSSMGGSTTNSFVGLLDAVAVHRRTLTDEILAKRFQRKGGSQGVLVESNTMPELGDIPENEVLVQISEGLADYRRWPYAAEMPKETDRWMGDAFLLPRVPRRYDDWGIRSSWKAPLLVRMGGDVALPEGTHRILVRARALARLWIEGELVAETEPASGSSPNGHDLVTPLAEPPHPGLRVKDYKHQEVFGTVSIPPGTGTSRVVLELIAGGKRQRTETGEVTVAIESADGSTFSILRPEGLPELPLTDAAVEPVLAGIRQSLDDFDDAHRLAAEHSRDSFWERRHAHARDWVMAHPAPSPPGEGHPIDAFLDAKLEEVRAENAALSGGQNGEFHQKVLPVLREKCFRCHGEKEKGGLKLDSLEAALRGGDSEIASIVPGDPGASELVERIRSREEDLVMPPTGDPLTGEQVATIESWIRGGAPWPEPPIPADRLAKTPRTSDEAFLRRLSLDIIGLPPLAEEVRDFLADSSPDKRTRAIDHLLADGRWVDHAMGDWLDLLAENPTLLNQSLNSTGPFRWFLYDSLHDGKGLDRLVTELLLMRGDAAHGGSAGFAMAGENDAPFAAKGHIVASAFLGIELQCARCHDSPYHSTTQRDLYSLAAMLSRQTVTVPATSRVPAGFFEKKARQSLIQVTLKPDEPVTPDWPFAAVTGVTDDASLDALVEKPDDSRERFAALITSPENRRFPRVMVNRLWKRLMGAGFVEPAHDWEGNEPSHPELLDWLANELVSHDYDFRYVTRLILTSAAYQREAASQPLVALTTRERLFAAPGHRRLTAEQVVDSLHAAAGVPIDSEELTFVHDGSHPLGNRLTLGVPRRAWMFTSLNNERDRPSLALPRAQAVVDVLQAFGWTGSRQKPIFERNVDPNVLQPGILANGVLVQNLSRAAAGSELAELAIHAESPQALLEELFLRFLGRKPLPTESEEMLPALAEGFDDRLLPPEQVRPVAPPDPLPLVTWLNHVSPEANSIQLEVEKRAQRGPAPDPRFRSDWRETYEDLVWSLINDREFVWIP
ncbi:MAG: DUF1553 domain-containing protein [Verrucomicrobiae bacterium]|nr:DUF1553 domain-containing protein [Verrucomicrobiae bacterium]